MTFSHRGMNVCPICEASHSRHTLYIGNFVPMHTWCLYFPIGKKKTNKIKKRVTASILKPTYDQKPDTFLGLKICILCFSLLHLQFLFDCYIAVVLSLYSRKEINFFQMKSAQLTEPFWKIVDLFENYTCTCTCTLMVKFLLMHVYTLYQNQDTVKLYIKTNMWKLI